MHETARGRFSVTLSLIASKYRQGGGARSRTTGHSIDNRAQHDQAANNQVAYLATLHNRTLMSSPANSRPLALWRCFRRPLGQLPVCEKSIAGPQVAS